MSALRLTLPYHDQRRSADLQRADHLVSTNIGRTLQSMRQAVLDTRAAVRWLKNEGYERVGILGTSVGSCIAFLAFAHEPDLNAGTFNHSRTCGGCCLARNVYQHVRADLGCGMIEELRNTGRQSRFLLFTRGDHGDANRGFLRSYDRHSDRLR